MHVEVNQSEVRPTEVMVHEYSSPVQWVDHDDDVM